MRTPSCMSVLPPLRLKSGIVEPEETAVAWQRFGRHVPAVTNTHARTENC
jgi:hypothetical protein